LMPGLCRESVARDRKFPTRISLFETDTRAARED